jgi:branched-chain amino acid transport system substrate-binding protein
VAAANPNVKLYGPDGVAEEAFTNPKKGGIPASVAARTKITVATLGLQEFKKRGNAKAEKFFTDYAKTYGNKSPDPYAIYGYETMALALDTLKKLGDKANDRAAVVKQLVGGTKGRNSVLGTYDIDKNGDTTLTDYGLYTIDNKGLPSFQKVIKAQAK